MQAKSGKVKVILLGVAGLLFVASVAGNVYLFMQYRTLSADPQRQARQEMVSLVSDVSKLMVLPEGEDPTIATVADVEKLKDQPFFAKAAVGDKVLLYTTAKKAILYRPSANLIVEVAPINLGNTQAATQQTAPAADTATQGTDTTTP